MFVWHVQSQIILDEMWWNLIICDFIIPANVCLG